jgi:hypothetical protein
MEVWRIGSNLWYQERFCKNVLRILRIPANGTAVRECFQKNVFCAGIEISNNKAQFKVE